MAARKWMWGALILAVALLSEHIYLPVLQTDYCCRPFSEEGWKQANLSWESQDCTRHEMTRDLIDRIRWNKLDKDRTALRKVLGLDVTRNVDGQCDVYFLGYCGSGTDGDRFELCFDKNDKAVLGKTKSMFSHYFL